MRLAVSLLVLMSLAAPARAQQSWKDWLPKLPSSPGSVQHDAARKMAPVKMQLRPSGGEAPEVRTLRVRVWAAADYRRQTVEWQSRFRRIVERVNALCRGWPGVRFEIVDVRDWERDSEKPSMAALVDDLAATDAGDDVDLVVGLVAALPVFPGAIENIGMARFFSKHMVMRSLHDLAEYNEVRRLFDTLTDREREALLVSRKLHKEQVIFLHEWAHTLGVIHDRRPSALMSPSYDSEQVGFDETEARLIEIGLQHRRDDGPRWREGSAGEIRALVEKSPDPDWDPKDRQQLLEMVTPMRQAAAPPAATKAPAATTAPPAPPAPPAPTEGPLGEADRATLAEARALAEAARYDEALHQLAPLEAHHARSPEVRLAVCGLAYRHPPGAARAALAESACKQANEVAPRDPRPQLYLAALYLEANDMSRARAPLSRAEELLAAAADPAAWKLLAQLLEKARLPTMAVQAARHADATTAAEVDRWASALRQKMDLPADGVTPELEAEYIRVVETARAAFGTRREASAIASAQSEFAGLGELLRREAGEARRHHRR